MGYNRAGARLRERRKRRRNLERIYRETHCGDCGDDCRSDLSPVWNKTGTHVIATLCFVCRGYRDLETFEKNGLIQNDLFAFAAESYAHCWGKPESERNPNQIPFFPEGSCKKLVCAEKNIREKAFAFMSAVWPGLWQASLQHPLLVGKTTGMDMIVSDWMQQGEADITLQQSNPQSGGEQFSVTFGLFNGHGEDKGSLVMEIIDIYCTEEQALRMLDQASRSPPECKPVAV